MSKPVWKWVRSLALLAGILAVPVAAHAQISPEWFGTWDLDVASSTFIGPVHYVRGTWKVEQRSTGEIVMIYDQVGVRGGVTHMEWKGRFDGTDQRIHGPDAVVTYAYRVVDERTLDLLVKVDGRPSAGSRVALLPDGTVRATTQNGTARGTVTTDTIYRKR